MRSRPAGWVPPGPLPPGPGDDPELAPGPGETLDCLAGHWKLFQLQRGHRYSTDDLLTAWTSVDQWRRRGETPATLLDLGCGVGSVLLLALWSFPEARGVGVEAQPVSASLARRSLRYNGAAERAVVVEGDFRDPDLLEPALRFHSITGSPPYLGACEGRRSDHPQRGPCRFEDRGGAEAYLGAAAVRLDVGGLFTWVHATRRAAEVLEAADGAGLRAVQWRNVVFREGHESLISVFSAGRGDRWSAHREEDLVVRRADGTWSEGYRGVRLAMGFPASEARS